MNNRILRYARMVKDGKLQIRDIPEGIRKDVISTLREILAIADAMREDKGSEPFPMHAA